MDKHGLADALRGMGQSEREIQHLLDTVSVNVVTPTVGPKVTRPNLRKAHDLPVCGVVTKGAHTYDIVREKVDSADEESLAPISGGSGKEEMESVQMAKKKASKIFRLRLEPMPPRPLPRPLPLARNVFLSGLRSRSKTFLFRKLLPHKSLVHSLAWMSLMRPCTTKSVRNRLLQERRLKTQWISQLCRSR